MASLASMRMLQIRPILANLRKINTRSSPLLRMSFAAYPANVKMDPILNCSVNYPVISFQRSMNSYAEDRIHLKLEDIKDRVMQVCRNHESIDKSKLTMESHFMNDLGLDSLDHIEIIMEIEDEFNFQIKDTEADTLFRPIDIINFIKQRDETWTETDPDSELPH